MKKIIISVLFGISMPFCIVAFVDLTCAMRNSYCDFFDVIPAKIYIPFYFILAALFAWIEYDYLDKKEYEDKRKKELEDNMRKFFRDNNKK